ncbi:acetylcholinesterase-like [Amphiura filiformis]|uniref:acetylcholinesterase-like n=1 Tax=Amphiura filiformis TaxID=82378 RepID=UPI003B2223C6
MTLLDTSLIFLCGFIFALSYGDELTVTANPRVVIPDVGAVIGETYHYVRNEYPIIDTYVDVFRGIPFAEPPLGQYRFTKPVPAAPFTEDYNATYYRSPCTQLGTDDGDEDCLHLNIWAPNPRVPDAAVMIWIHGGGYIIGDGVEVKVDGSPLVGFNNVVYVTIQYRLNSFGFLTTGDSALPGNYGLWDQLLAIQWVKTNIAAFGGNPENIMIFGQSAGGGSVGLHLLSPHSWPYYHRAAMQSGTGTSPWALEYDIEKARSEAIEVGEQCGCDTTSSTALLECLREIPAKNITAATNTIAIRTVNVTPFIPIVDNDFLSDDPRRLVSQGKFKQCELLLGSNKDEGSSFAMRAFPEQIPRRVPYIPRSRWDSVVPMWVFMYTNDLILDAVDQQYIDWTVADDPDANYFWIWVDMNTDEGFACPTDTYARTWSQHGNDVYLYQLTHLPSNHEGLPTWLGVAHNDELQFVFGRALNPLGDLEQTPEEINMTVYIMKSWTNFAKTGNPNSEPLTPADMDTFWPAYSIPELNYKDLSPTMSNKQSLKAEICHFWNEFAPKMVTFSADLQETEKQWREEFYSWKHTDMPEWRDAFDDYQAIKSTCEN